jgi:hypothetical protein
MGERIVRVELERALIRPLGIGNVTSPLEYGRERRVGLGKAIIERERMPRRGLGPGR